MVTVVVGAVGNPWRSIWFHPQAAIRCVVEQRPTRGVLLIAVLGGIGAVFSQVVAIFGFSQLSPGVALLAFVLGPIVGGVGLYLNAALLGLTGSLLGGRASFQKLRAALAWSQAPLLVSLAIMLALLALRIFVWPLEEPDPTDPAFTAITVCVAIAAILQLWAMFLSIRTIGAVQEFGFFRSILNIVLATLLAVLFAVVFRTFAFQPFNIPSSSMAPTLMVGDYMFANKFSYGYGRYSLPINLSFAGRIFGAEPKRGDLVVFRLHKDPNVDYVKRVIGLPGDEVAVKNGIVVLNGQPLGQEKLGEGVIPMSGKEAMKVTRYRETLPDGRAYEIARSALGAFNDTGITYQVPVGQYFVLGDNRDNSSDSRFPQVGYVYHDDLVGRISVIFYSAAEGGLAKNPWDRMFRIPQ